MQELLNQPISEEELRFYLRKLKNKKAPGIDGICAEFLKYGEDCLLQPLLAMYNYMLQKGDFPSQWAEGMSNPLPKSGLRNNPYNYREMSLLIILGKLLEQCSRDDYVLRMRFVTKMTNSKHGFL